VNKIILLKLFSGVALAQGIVFAFTPILASYYGVEVFGEFGFFYTVASILSIVYIGRLDLAISKAKSFFECRIALSGIMFFFIISSFISYFLYQVSFTLFDFDQIGFFELFMGGVAIGVFLVSNSLMVYHEDYSGLAKQKVVRAFLTVSLQFGLFFLMPNEGMIYGCIVSYIIVSIMFSFKDFKPVLKRNMKAVFVAMERHKNIIKYNLTNDLICAFSANLPVLLAMTVSAKVAGVYFLAERLVRTPIYLIGTTIRPIIIRSFIGLDRHEKIKKYKSYIKKLMYLSFFILTLYFSMAWVAFDYVDLYKWVDLWLYARAIVCWALASLVNTPTSAFLTQTDKSNVLFYAECITLIVRLVPGALLMLGMIKFAEFILAFSALSIVGYLVLVVFSVRSVQKELKLIKA